MNSSSKKTRKTAIDISILLLSSLQKKIDYGIYLSYSVVKAAQRELGGRNQEWEK